MEIYRATTTACIVADARCTSARNHPAPSAALGGERMQNGGRPTVAGAVGEIAEMLAKAYLRYSKLLLTGAASGFGQHKPLITRVNRALMELR